MIRKQKEIIRNLRIETNTNKIKINSLEKTLREKNN